MDYDAIVIGGGLAGLHTTRLLATCGLKTLCLEQNLIGDVIQVTGLFVQRAFEDVPFPPRLFGLGLSRVTIHAPGGRTVTAEHANRRFYVADMPAVLEWMAGQARQVGAEIRERHRLVDLEATEAGVRVLVQYPGGEPFPLTARFVLGADGPRSEVAAALDLPRYRRFLHGVEEVHTSDRADENGGIHLFFGRRIAQLLHQGGHLNSFWLSEPVQAGLHDILSVFLFKWSTTDQYQLLYERWVTTSN